MEESAKNNVAHHSYDNRSTLHGSSQINTKSKQSNLDPFGIRLVAIFTVNSRYQRSDENMNHSFTAYFTSVPCNQIKPDQILPTFTKRLVSKPINRI